MSKGLKPISIIAVITILSLFVYPFLQTAQAVALTNLSNTMSTLRAVTLSNHAIVFLTPSGAQGHGTTPDTITVTFPAGFTMGTFALLNFDIGASVGGQTSCPAGLAYTERTLGVTQGTDTWGVSQSGQVVTFTAPNNAGSTAEVPINACVRIRIGNNAVTGGAGVNQITNPTVTVSTSFTIAISGNPGFGNSGNITVQILPDDAVAIAATVGQTLSFSIAVTSLALGTLSVTAPMTASHNISLATNAPSGMVVTFSGATLTSGAHTITAMSVTAASAPGAEQFGINAVANTAPSVGAACSGTAPIAAAAAGYSTVNQFKFVSGETVVSSTSAINTTTCTLSYIANIAGITEAGSYTTTLTFIATATF